MKRRTVLISSVLIGLVVGWVAWSQLISSQHRSIAIDEVNNVKFAGESIQNDDGWRHATDREAEQIVK